MKGFKYIMESPNVYKNKYLWILSQLTGVVIFFIVIIIWTQKISVSLVMFDEGILLSNTFFINKGLVPYKDFYSNYPPGIYYILKIIWEFAGVSIISERILGLIFHLTISLSLGRITGIIVNRNFSIFSASICALWISYIAPVSYAYLGAVGLCLIIIMSVLNCMKSKSDWSWIFPGILMAFLSFLRHDLFAYFSFFLIITIILVLVATSAKLSVLLRKRETGYFLSSMLVVISIFWGPTLFRGGLNTFYDLLIYQIKYTMPARVKPLPPFLKLNLQSVPLFLAYLFEGSVFLCIIGPITGLGIYLSKRRYQNILQSFPVLLVTILSLSVFPQMYGRTDIYHSLFAVAPAICLLTSIPFLFRSKYKAYISFIIIFILLISPTISHINKYRSPNNFIKSISDIKLLDESRKNVIDEINKRTDENDSIFVGLKTNRLTFANEIEFYYLTRRLTGTRYSQYDPNFTNREEFQRNIINDLRKNKTKLILLSENFDQVIENNKSKIKQSKLLDEFIQKNYKSVKIIKPYEIWIKKI